MKRTALIASLALAFTAPAFAQDAPQNPPVADQPTHSSATVMGSTP